MVEGVFANGRHGVAVGHLGGNHDVAHIGAALLATVAAALVGHGGRLRSIIIDVVEQRCCLVLLRPLPRAGAHMKVILSS